MTPHHATAVRSSLPREVAEALVESLPGASPGAASTLGSGYAVDAFSVPAPGRDYVVRVPRERSWWAVEDLEREVRLLPLLERAGFEIVTPREARLLRGGDGRVLGTVHRTVPGEPLSARPVRGQRALEALAVQIARFLTRLHAIPAEAARAHGAREADLWSDEYEALIAQVLPDLGPRSRAWLERTAEEFRRAGGSAAAPRVLVHGDLSGDHLLRDADGDLCGVIDFAGALIADPALDFAGILNQWPWSFLERVWAHYRGHIDPDAARRTRFYIDVAPLYRIAYGGEAVGEHERRAGLRQIAARAAVTTRREQGPARGRS